MISYTLPIRVRFAETDAMGIVHHANYILYFEAARIAMMDKMGLSYKELIKMGYHLPLIEANAKYRSPSYFDDNLEVTAKLCPMEGPRVKVEYVIVRDGKILAEGFTTHAFINEKGLPVRPPKEFLDRLKK